MTTTQADLLAAAILAIDERLRAVERQLTGLHELIDRGANIDGLLCEGFELLDSRIKSLETDDAASNWWKQGPPDND
jgi:hypothetical protein